MQIKPNEAAPQPRLPSIRPQAAGSIAPPASELTQTQGSALETRPASVSISLSGAVRALAAALNQVLPDLGTLQASELLTQADRIMLVRARDFASGQHIALGEVKKLVVDLCLFRALEQGSDTPFVPLLQSAVAAFALPTLEDAPLDPSSALEAEGTMEPAKSEATETSASGAAANGLRTPSTKPHAQGAAHGTLTLPSFSPRDEALARTILSGSALRETPLDRRFVQALLDPDQQPSHAVDFEFLRRLVVALSPAPEENAVAPRVSFVRRDARVQLAQAVSALALSLSELPALDAASFEQGGRVLAQRLPQLLAQVATQLHGPQDTSSAGPVPAALMSALSHAAQASTTAPAAGAGMLLSQTALAPQTQPNAHPDRAIAAQATEVLAQGASPLTATEARPGTLNAALLHAAFPTRPGLPASPTGAAVVANQAPSARTPSAFASLPEAERTPQAPPAALPGAATLPSQPPAPPGETSLAPAAPNAANVPNASAEPNAATLLAPMPLVPAQVSTQLTATPLRQTQQLASTQLGLGQALANPVQAHDASATRGVAPSALLDRGPSAALRTDATLREARSPDRATTQTSTSPHPAAKHETAVLTRNDRALLGLLYAAAQQRGATPDAVDEVARALIGLRRAEHAEAPAAPPPPAPRADVDTPATPTAAAAPHASAPAAMQDVGAAIGTRVPFDASLPAASPGPQVPAELQPALQREMRSAEPFAPAPAAAEASVHGGARSFGSSTQLAARMAGSYGSFAPPSMTQANAAAAYTAAPTFDPLLARDVTGGQLPATLPLTLATRPLDVAQALGVKGLVSELRARSRRALQGTRGAGRDTRVRGIDGLREAAYDAEADDPLLERNARRRRRVRWQLLLERRKRRRKQER